MECVRYVSTKPAKLRMNAWLYDENSWPSGFGGGLVNNLGEKYQQRKLPAHALRSLVVKLARKIKHSIATTPRRRIFLRTSIPKKKFPAILTAYYEASTHITSIILTSKSWPSLSAQSPISIIMANLPRRCDICAGSLPRRAVVAQRFGIGRYSRGYQVNTALICSYQLPALNWTCRGRVKSVRFGLAAELFNENFMKQIREWCDKAQMDDYRPPCFGGRLPTRSSQRYGDEPVSNYHNIPELTICAGRSLDAGANPDDVRRRLFGRNVWQRFRALGWNMNFSRDRRMFQQQLAHVISCVQHLQSYTLRGLRKRDYPPSLFISSAVVGGLQETPT